MADQAEWTTADFETLSWHDCHFYGLKLEEGENGTAELEFDIDFILEWQCQDGPPYKWRVAPAVLVFHSVFDLRVELDYAGAAMTAFTIAGIEREPLSGRFRWRLPMNWPRGLISFESPGFTQSLRGAPILVDRQHLFPMER